MSHSQPISFRAGTHVNGSSTQARARVPGVSLLSAMLLQHLGNITPSRYACGATRRCLTDTSPHLTSSAEPRARETQLCISQIVDQDLSQAGAAQLHRHLSIMITTDQRQSFVGRCFRQHYLPSRARSLMARHLFCCSIYIHRRSQSSPTFKPALASLTHRRTCSKLVN